VKPAKNRKREPKRAALFGVGLDNKDGHKRITTGEKFLILGGSEETHERMTETIVKTFEELKQRGKPLEAVNPKELSDILNRSTPR
jgi:hypothetical protein